LLRLRANACVDHFRPANQFLLLTPALDAFIRLRLCRMTTFLDRYPTERFVL
jgi:hypothetical protein